MASFYSFLVAVIWFNIAMLFVEILSRRLYFLVKYSTSVLLACAALGIVRMLLPLDFTFAYVIRSFELMPLIRDFFEHDVVPGPEYLKLGTFIIGVWAAGSVVVSVQTIRQLVVESQARKQYVHAESEQLERVCAGMGLKRAELVVSPEVYSPMMTGIFKARIYLPEAPFTDGQLEMIILHEYQHFKSHDTLIKLFYLALSAFFWWNPVVHKFQNRLDHLLELRCDANVTKNMDDAGKERYLSAILAVIKQLQSFAPEKCPIASASFVKAGAGDFIKQRFNFVLNGTKKSPVAQTVFMSILLLLFLSSYMVVVQPAGFPRGNEMEAGVRITPENAYVLVLEDGSMKLYVDGEFFWDVSEDELHDDLHSKLPIHEGSN